MIAVLCGGVGAARFLEGARLAFADEEIVAIVNVGDDDSIHGLHISPDIDTILYTLSGLVNASTGWGIADESWKVMERLQVLGGETWFRLGDLDLATHLYRTGRLAAGATLSEVTAELAEKLGVGIEVVPATDDKLRTLVHIQEVDSSQKTLRFQEYFVQRRTEPRVIGIRYALDTRCSISAGALRALHQSRALIIAPSNPILSIAPMFEICGFGDLITSRRSDVYAISPIVAGKAIKGPAARVMESLGLEPSALGIANFYKAFAENLIIDNQDSELRSKIEDLELKVHSVDTMMTSLEKKMQLALHVRECINAG